jgi:hypothetical protein
MENYACYLRGPSGYRFRTLDSVLQPASELTLVTNAAPVVIGSTALRKGPAACVKDIALPKQDVNRGIKKLKQLQ